MKENKISLYLAILININIVIGSAFFLNAGLIARKCKGLAPLAWLIVGTILLPLVLVLADLSSRFPVSGGIYIFSHKILGSFSGFISGWGYYIGTAAGNAVVIHAFSELSEKMGLAAPLHSLGIRGLGIDISFVALFAVINLFNIELLGKVQGLFTLLKTIPFAVLILGAFSLFQTGNLEVSSSLEIINIFKSIPLVLFAYLGIEACCAIGHIIKDGKKNTSKAILTSFALIVSIYVIAQLLIVGIHGTADVNPFSGIIPRLTNNTSIIKWGTLLIDIALLSSFLGGFYGMFYTNNWNLFSIAEKKELPFDKLLIKLNKYQAPNICILVQTLVVIGFLTVTSNLENLITMSDFGIVIAYLLSSIAFLVVNKKRKIVVGALSVLSCSYLMYASFENLFYSGLFHLIPFLGIIGLGIAAYKFKTIRN